MVGTPTMIVTPCAAIVASAAAGSNRGSIVTLAPQRTAVFSVTVCPNEWNRGRPPKIISSGVSCSRVVAVTSALRVRLAWVSSAPLGRPVVPDV
jgi:hypothetical protein